MFFTREDINKIYQALLKLGIKDSELPETSDVKNDDTLAIVQDGKNKQINIREFLNQISLWKKEDFINVTDKYKKSHITLVESIQAIPIVQRKEGLVITFLDTENNWRIYQFRGSLLQFNNETLWVDLYDFSPYIIDPILPDEEDITQSAIDEQGNTYLSLKDREYNPSEFSGKGYKILRRNIIEIEDENSNKVKKNILTQDMINEPNTVYEIRYDFDLNDAEITIPDNCVLKFNGGNVYGGTINFNRCFLEGSISLQCKCLGQYLNTELNPRWFGAIGDGKSHKISEYYKSIEEAKKSYPFIDSLDCEIDYCGIQSALNIITNTAEGKLIIPNGVWLINRTLVCKSGRPHIEGVNAGNEEYKVHGTILKWIGDNGTEDEPNYILKLYTTKADNTYDPDVTFHYRNRPILRSLMFATNVSEGQDKLTYYVSGVFIGPSSLFLIEDVRFTKLYDGIVFSTILLSDLSRCWFYSIYRDCLSIRRNKVEGSTTLRISKTEFSIFRRYAIFIESQVPADNFIITECDFEGTSLTTTRPKEDFVQGIKSAICLIGSSNTIIQNNRFEACNGHSYNLHLCNCEGIKILNNIFDVGNSLAAISLSASDNYTSAYTDYYNKYFISDITNKRNFGISNTKITNHNITIINNDTINGYFKIHVLGKFAFANASLDKSIIINSRNISNCIECYAVKENTVDYSKTINLGYGKPCIFGKDIFDIDYFSVSRVSEDGNDITNINMGSLPIYLYSSRDKKIVSENLKMNVGVVNIPGNLLENRPMFYKDETESTRYESGIFTKTKIRYGGSHIPNDGDWEIGDIYYNRNVKYGSKCVGWVCVESGSPGKWMSFGNLFDETLLINGSTNQRPTLTSKNEGFEYYDTTLKKKIIWNGSEWVNLDNTNLDTPINEWTTIE